MELHRLNSGRRLLSTLALVLVVTVFINKSSCCEQNLRMPSPNECVCPGYSLQLTCTAVGIGTTVWTVGQQCSFGLEHSRFEMGVNRSCNELPGVTGRSLSFNGDCYTSQVTIMVTSDLNGTNVTCEHDGTAGIEHIGDYQILLTSAPPDDVRLTNITSEGLTFSWSSVAPNCSAVSYNISSQGCGECPVSTASTTATCQEVQLTPNMQTCELSVQTIVCDSNIASNHSNSIITVLPSAMELTPTVKISPKYQQSTTRLISFIAIINKIAPISISGINIAVQSFTVKQLINGSVCDYRKIELNSQACIGNVCNVMSDSNCTVEITDSSDIVVIVSATSDLGTGQESQSTVDGTYINFVNVTHENNHIICTFMNLQDESSKSCNATYARCGEQQTQMAYNDTSESQLMLNLKLTDQTTYCYTVNASNNTVSLLIEGNITGTAARPGGQNGLQPGEIAGIVVVGILILVAIVAAAILLLLYRTCKRKGTGTFEEPETKEMSSATDWKSEASNSHKRLGHDNLRDSEEESIKEDRKDLTQKVQPGVREPEDAHPSTTEDSDAVPRLALAEESDNQQQQDPKFHCPCGKCTLEGYLQQGCPDGYFPHLELSKLDQHEREDLIQLLSKETKEIIICFTNLIDSTCSSLNKRGVTTQELARRVLELGVYSSPIVVQKPLMSEESTELTKSTTIAGSFLVLQPHMSFFNFELLKHIIDGKRTGSDEDRKELADYEKKFKRYCTRRIVDVPQGAIGLSSTNLSKRQAFLMLVVKGNPLSELSLEDIKTAKRDIATLLGVKSSTLYLHKIDEGSLILVFSVPEFVARELFPLRPAQRDTLKKSGFFLFAPCDAKRDTIEATNEPMAQHTLIPEESQIENDPTEGQQLEVLSVPDEKPAALHPHEGLGHDELDSSICKDLTQEVQPGVREPEDAHPSTTEDPDAVPKLALAEESDNQRQQATNVPMAQHTRTPDENQTDVTETPAGLEQVDESKYALYEIDKGCGLFEFFNEREIEFCRGCAFFELKKTTEDIHRNSRVILIHKNTGDYFSGEAARKMVHLLPSPKENKQVDIKRPDDLLESYRVFIQDRGSGTRYLPGGSTILLHTEGLEVVPPERFLQLSVEEDCELLTFIESQMDPRQPDKKLVFHRGNAFYEFSHKSEDITGKKEVVLMDVKTETLYTGERAKIMLGVPGKGIRNPYRNGGKWRVFVQSSCTGNRHLNKGTIVMYENVKKPFTKSNPSTSSIYMDDVKDKFEVMNVAKDCSLRDFVEKEKGANSYERGCAYYELADKEEDIDSCKEVILMNMNGKLFSGPAAARRIGAPGINLKNPGLPEYSRVFIRCNGPGNVFIRMGTSVLYEDPKNLIPVDVEDFYRFEVGETCELRKFVEQELENLHRNIAYKKGNAYFQFTCATEDIEKNKKVLLKDKEGNLFTGPVARRIIGAPGIGIPKPGPNFEYKVFIQNRSRGSRCLIKGSVLYYKKD